jgi:hypothetical protein
VYDPHLPFDYAQDDEEDYAQDDKEHYAQDDEEKLVWYHLDPLSFISVLYGLLGTTYILNIHTAEPMNRKINRNKIRNFLNLFVIQQ